MISAFTAVPIRMSRNSSDLRTIPPVRTPRRFAGTRRATSVGDHRRVPPAVHRWHRACGAFRTRPNSNAQQLHHHPSMRRGKKTRCRIEASDALFCDLPEDGSVGLATIGAWGQFPRAMAPNRLEADCARNLNGVPLERRPVREFLEILRAHTDLSGG